MNSVPFAQRVWICVRFLAPGAGNIPAAVEALGSAAARFVLAPSNGEREMQVAEGSWAMAGACFWIFRAQ